jgi:hypothetical protein
MFENRVLRRIFLPEREEGKKIAFDYFSKTGGNVFFLFHPITPSPRPASKRLLFILLSSLFKCNTGTVILFKADESKKKKKAFNMGEGGLSRSVVIYRPVGAFCAGYGITIHGRSTGNAYLLQLLLADSHGL